MEVCCNFVNALKLGYTFMRAKSTQARVPGPLAAGARSHAGVPREHEAHWPGLNRGARARARYRATPATIAGVVGRARSRGWALSMRKNNANHLRAAPLLLGHRRRSTRQWRTAATRYRNTARTNRDRVDATVQEREGKGGGDVRKLTPKRTGESARSEAACGGRNRRRRPVGVEEEIR